MRSGIFRGPRCRCAPRVGASVAPCPVYLGPQRQFRSPEEIRHLLCGRERPSVQRRESPGGPKQAGQAQGEVDQQRIGWARGWRLGLGTPSGGGAVNYSGHWCHTTGGVTSEGGRPLGNAHLFRVGLERSEYSAVVPGSSISEHHESKALGAWLNPLPFLDEDRNQVLTSVPSLIQTPPQS